MNKGKRSALLFLSCLILGIGMSACGPNDREMDEVHSAQTGEGRPGQTSGEALSETYSVEPDYEVITEDVIVLKGPEKGERVTFGEYLGEPIVWDVLERDNDTVLLLSHYLLDAKPYNGLTWEKSRLRQWLNGDFISAAFSDAEMKKLCPMAVWVDGVQGEEGGRYKVCDKVTILSKEEVLTYFPTPEEREAGVSVRYANRMIQENMSAGVEWWLRSSAISEDYTYKTDCVDNDGEFCLKEEIDRAIPRSVRPVIRMKLGDTASDFCDASYLSGTIEIAKACLGMKVEDASNFLHDAYGVWGSHSKADYFEGEITFFDNNVTVGDVPFKRIHFFLDERMCVNEIDYCLTEAQSLSMGPKQSEEIEKDLGLPAEEAFHMLLGRIRGVAGSAGESCNLDWIKAEKSEGLTWSVDGGLTIVAAWGKNCFSINGNDQFELSFTNDKEFYPGKYVTWLSLEPLDPEIQRGFDLVNDCIGKTLEEAKELFLKASNATFGEVHFYASDYEGAPDEYIYYATYSLAGIDCNVISFWCDPDTGLVYGFTCIKQDGTKSEDMAVFFHDYMEKLTASFGKPQIDIYGDHYFEIGNGITASYSGEFSDYYGAITFFFEKEELKQ